MNNTIQTPPPDSLGSPSGSAACPEWKTPKHIHDQQEQAKIRAMTVEQALPSSVHRLGWLRDRDAQLHQLLDYLQSLGIPMGSETWALRTLLKIRRLEAESDAARRVIRAINDKELPDLDRLRRDFEHARVMHAKHLPPMEIRCDWCGWPDARLIGGGNAACDDCLPNSLEYQRNRRTIDPILAAAHRIRTRTRQAFRRIATDKPASTEELLGTDWQALKAHIESQFVEGMSWENMSDWHIDHIIPLASATTEEELAALCHYTNLQPLFALDNLRKGAKLITP